MSEIKVNGPEDAEVSEMIKQLLLENIYTITLHGPDGGSKFVEDCETCALAEVNYGVKERNPKPQRHCVDMADVEVVWVRNLRIWKKLHVGGVHGMSCQHLQVMVTNLHENRRKGSQC